MDDFRLAQLSADKQEELLRRAQALGLKRKKSSLPPITRQTRGEHLPLSFAQQRLWFLAQLEEVSKHYHVTRVLRLRGDLDCRSLRRALDRIVERHEVLRTTFEMREGEPVQRIRAVEEGGFELEERDLREMVRESGELERVVGEEAGRPFDLKSGPLIRGQLLRTGEDEYVLVIVMHHIVSDGWSIGILVKEISALYGAFVRGEEDPLPELEVQYADYAVWHRKWTSGVVEEQARYWKERLEGIPAVLELPADHERPGQQDYRGAVVKVELDRELTGGLKELSRRQGTTLFMTVLGGWAALLGRLSGQTEVVVGVPVANRRWLEIEKLIGFFVNTLAMRVDVKGTATVEEMLQGVKREALATQQHQDIPFEQVVEVVRPPRSLAHSPIFQVALAWENVPGGTLDLPGIEVSALPGMSTAMAKFDLTLALGEEEGRIVGELEYATGLFERTTIERYVGYFRRLLEGMVADEGQRVDRLPLLPLEEREELVKERNRNEREYRWEKCVHEMFEEQVAKHGEAVAVVYGKKEVSYEELNRRANRLGHYLRGLGVGPDVRVGICVERGLEMVVGLLGVLKAGGAYVPLDPEYPVERLGFMLADSEPRVVLTQGKQRELIKQLGREAAVVDLEEDEAWRHEAATNLDSRAMGLTPEHLAYVIYTSGSTGEPKGVMIEHRNTVNLICWARASFTNGVLEQTLFSTSLNFDLAVYECFVPLASGATRED